MHRSKVKSPPKSVARPKLTGTAVGRTIGEDGRSPEFLEVLTTDQLAPLKRKQPFGEISDGKVQPTGRIVKRWRLISEYIEPLDQLRCVAIVTETRVHG